MNLDVFQPAATLHAEGRLEEAKAAYEALLNGPADQIAVTRQLLGMVHADQGDMEGALSQYDDALSLGLKSAALMFSRGEALRKLHRTAEAAESYKTAASLDSQHAETRHMAGVALAALGRHQEAAAYYRQAVQLSPDLKRPWNNLGVSLETLGRLDEAVAGYERAIALDPDYVQARHNRGSALLKLERLEEALADLDAVVARNAEFPESWNLRAVVLVKLDRSAEALQSVERALRLRPHYAEAENNRSVALRALKLYEAALEAAEAALAIRPAFAEALNSRGSALAKLNRYEAAMDSYRQALSLSPQNASIQLNLGLAAEALGDLAAAEAALAEAERLSPTTPDAPFARGLVRIRAGDIQAGFQLYETRWTQRGGPILRYPKDRLWLGEEPLGERRLLIHAEQGLGDTIQFCRFAPLAAPAPQRMMQVQPPLMRLLSRLEGVGEVGSTADPDPAFDVHIPMMSLPLALKLDVGELTPTMPYLSAEPGLAALWRERLPPTDRPRVGLAWTGNPQHDNDHNRSMTLESLRPLLSKPAQFISLQKDYRLEDQAELEKTPKILRFEDRLADFADTAALIAACDLVISVDTSVAHLAGAMGKATWLMLPCFSDWRWMNERTDTPWYPSVVLFRQTAFGDWRPVIDAISERLERL